MKRVLLFLMCGLPMSGFSAGWSERYSVDDGGRLYVSAKVGAVNTRAIDMSNDLGYTNTPYYVIYYNGTGETELVSELDRFMNLAGENQIGGAVEVNIGSSKPRKKLDAYSFYSSLALGFVTPGHPNWRGEFAWDHVSEFNYNENPLLTKNYYQSVYLNTGDSVIHYNYNTTSHSWESATVSSPIAINEPDREYDVFTGAVTSNVNVDLYMFNMYYDFFSGVSKPLKTWIPYIGLGFGYANIITTMQLADEYGDLSYLQSLENYAAGLGQTIDVDGMGTLSWLEFGESKQQKGSLAASAMIGASYGITKNAYLDFGAKVSWIDKIQWSLTDDNSSSSTTGFGSKDIFSAKNNLLTSLSVGFRFEF